MGGEADAHVVLNSGALQYVVRELEWRPEVVRKIRTEHELLTGDVEHSVFEDNELLRWDNSEEHGHRVISKGFSRLDRYVFTAMVPSGPDGLYRVVTAFTPDDDEYAEEGP